MSDRPPVQRPDLPSLHRHTLLSTLVPWGLVAIAIGILTTLTAKAALERYTAARDQVAAANLAALVEPALRAGEGARARDLLNVFLGRNAIPQAWILGDDGRVELASDPAFEGQPPSWPESVRGLAESPREGHPAAARVVIRTDIRIVNTVTAIVGLGVALALALGALITGWTVNRLSLAVARPMVDAAHAAGAMAEGDFTAAQRLSRSAVRESEELRIALGTTAARLAQLTAGLEEEVRDRTSELTLATEKAHAARALAEEADQAKSLFLASMSHELRTPLNAIIGYAELLREDHAAEDAEDQDLLRIVQSARHLLALINDILDFTKMEAGRMQVHRATYHVRQVVEEAVAAVAPLIARRGNTLTVRVSEAVRDATGDAVKLRQVLINLLGNAGKFTENGTVSVDVDTIGEEHRRHLLISVADTGRGMDEAQKARLFKPFVSDEHQGAHGGTGLGLAICAHVCQLLGGEIRCESRRNHGTTFTVRIPLHLADDASSARPRVSTTQYHLRLGQRSAS